MILEASYLRVVEEVWRLFVGTVRRSFTKSQSIATIGRRTWIFLVLSGIATGLSWLCYFRALQLGDQIHHCPVALPHLDLIQL